MEMKMVRSSFNQKDIARIKAISKKFDVEILQALGLDSFSHNGVQCECPIHGGDNPTAFCYDTHKKIWSCFTQHCHKKHGNDMIGLIRSIKDCSFEDAVDWIDGNIGINQDIKIEDIYNSASIDDYLNSPKRTNSIIPESKLLNLSKDVSFLDERNFSKEAISEFEAGLCLTDQIIHQRIMIPVRNIDGDIVGFTGRSVHPLNKSTGGYHPHEFTPKNTSGKFFSKWRMYPKNFNKSTEIYNIHKAKERILETNTCFLVEGPFDVWRLWEFGIKNCVATLGTGLTLQQGKILAEAGCINLNIMYDSDKAGTEAAEKIKSRFKDDFYVYNIMLPDGIDPASMSQNLFNKKIASLSSKVNE